MKPADYVDVLRAEAATLRIRYGDESRARLCETHANELEETLRAYDDEIVSLKHAVRESGYAAKSLKRMCPNRSTVVGEYWFRRGDLPRKAMHAPAPERIPVLAVHNGEAAMSARQTARAVVSGVK
jgi:hypothetical protein